MSRPPTVSGGSRRSRHRSASAPVVDSPLTPAALQRRIESATFGHRIFYYPSIGSTNQRALELAATGAPEGSLVLAEEQTAGRGQRDRRWTSRPLVGIYVSLILRPGVPPAHAPQFTLVAAVSTADALREICGVPARIKWPNDIVAGGRKIAGVLGEVRSSAPTLRDLVIGIGINVNHDRHDFPPEIRSLATSVRIETGSMADRVALLAATLEGFERRYARLLRDGPDQILREWESLSAVRPGHRITLNEPGGRLDGTFRGIDAEGALLIENKDGTLTRARFGEIEPSGSR